jgi:hypothetical protein
MTLSNEKIFQLMQNSNDFTTQLVLTIDALADQVKNLNERLKQLEARDATKPTLRVVNDGS